MAQGRFGDEADSFVAALRLMAPDRVGDRSALELRARAADWLDGDLRRRPGHWAFRHGLRPGSAEARDLIETLRTPGGWNAQLAEIAPQLAADLLRLDVAVGRPNGRVETTKSSGRRVHLVELSDGTGRFVAAVETISLGSQATGAQDRRRG